MTPLEVLERRVRERTSVIPWKKILVPLDGSEISTWALARARRILSDSGIGVTLLRVIECEESRAKDLLYRLDSRHRDAHDALAGTRDRLLDSSVAVSALLRFGDPVTEILREVEEGDHDLLVMSTHGWTRLRRVILGTVAERVLHSSPAPLLLFRPMMGQEWQLPPGATREAVSFKRILVMLDGLEPAEEILPMAEGVARAFASELHLYGAIYGGSTDSAARLQAEGYFGSWAEALRQRGVACYVHLSRGDVAEGALALIRSRSIDSVALMTHGRSGLSRAIHGSVAQKLIRESGVPVLVWRNRRLRGALAQPFEKHRQMWVE